MKRFFRRFGILFALFLLALDAIGAGGWDNAGPYVAGFLVVAWLGMNTS